MAHHKKEVSALFDFVLNTPDISFSSRGKTEKFLRLIKEATCYFQGHFIDYSIVASNAHKNIRLCNEKTPDNLDELSKYTNSLVDHCNRKLDAVFYKTAEYLQSYFEIDDRHKLCKPRICVKTTFKGKIVDLFRDSGPTMPSGFLAVENTGFDRVINDGKQFICNNLPKEAKMRRYKNLRLHPISVDDYKFPNRFKRIVSRFSEEPCADPDWEKCWDVGKQNRPESKSCYKSTLIVPMTLRNADVSHGLREILQMDAAYEKSTFGYLCFDHRKTGFFRDPEDIHIGYFFADMLSLYMINRQNYIHNSDTFKKACIKLSNAGRINNGVRLLQEQEN